MKKRILVLPLLLTLLILFSACQTETPPSASPSSPLTYTATDFFGQEVALPSKPQRIVSLGPSATEIIYSLNALDRLVGVTTADDYPPQVASIEKVGGTDNPSLEKILSLQPDLVLAVFGNPMSLVDNLKEKGIPVFGLNPQTVSEVLLDIEKVGNLIGEHDQALKVVGDIQKTISSLQKKMAKTTTIPKVYIETWPQEPYYTFGAGTFGDDLIRLAGGENIASSIDEPYPALSTDYILFENPDAIVLAYMDSQGEANIKIRRGWENISAILNDKILIPADPNVYLRPGPRIKDALEELARFLHPEWFSSPNN